MAYVRKSTRPDGTIFYRAVWHTTDLKGRRKQETESFARHADAKAHAGRMEIEVERKGIADPDRQTVAIFFRRWIATLKQRSDLSPRTIGNYRDRFEAIAPLIGHIRLDRLTAAHLDEAYAGLLNGEGKASGRPRKDGTPRKAAAQSKGTVALTHAVVRAGLTQARRWKFIGENVAKDAKAPIVGKRRAGKVRTFSQAEVAALWQAATDADAAGRSYPNISLAVMLFLIAGLRRSELLGLGFDAIDFERGRIHIFRTVIAGLDDNPILQERTKTDESNRWISLPEAVMARLRQQRAFINEQRLAWGREYGDPNLVFPESGGRLMRPDTMTSYMRRLMSAAGIKGGQQPTHGYRHTMASDLLAGGTDLKSVSMRLGHSDVILTANLYIHPSENEDRAAAEAMAARFSFVNSAAKVPQDSRVMPEKAGKVAKIGEKPRAMRTPKGR